MQVLVQKDVSGRWLNRFAVMILIAIIAVQLSAYFKPEEGVARERARAAAVEGMLKEQARGHSELKAKYTREKEEAKAKLEGLAGRINERERESERKLGELSAALEQQKQETNRQAAEHTRWLEKMAVQVAETKRDSVAARGGAQMFPGLKVRLVIPAVRIPRLEGEEVVDENRLKPLGAQAERPIEAELAVRGQPEHAGAARAEALAVLYRRGVDAVVKRDYAAGIADLERVIRLAPGDVEAHTWCARAHYLSSDFPNAIKDLTKVIALRPNDKQSYHDRGMANLRIGDHAAAIADFDRAIGLDPAYAEAYLNRGSARLAVGDALQATQDFSLVLTLEPRSAAEAYRLRSAAYASMGWGTEIVAVTPLPRPTRPSGLSLASAGDGRSRRRFRIARSRRRAAVAPFRICMSSAPETLSGG
jgi:tetratricopeptide (TPR) repeat protein